MREPYEILVKPLVSEKSMLQMGENKYSFAVAKDANKIEIKHAVEKMFDGTKVKEGDSLIVPCDYGKYAVNGNISILITGV